MIALLRISLTVVAVTATWVAIASFLAHMEADTYLPLLIAILSLGALIAVDHLEDERDQQRAQTWRDTWERRDRGAGL